MKGIEQPILVREHLEGILELSFASLARWVDQCSLGHCSVYTTLHSTTLYSAVYSTLYSPVHCTVHCIVFSWPPPGRPRHRLMPEGEQEFLQATLLPLLVSKHSAPACLLLWAMA